MQNLARRHCWHCALAHTENDEKSMAFMDNFLFYTRSLNANETQTNTTQFVVVSTQRWQGN